MIETEILGYTLLKAVSFYQGCQNSSGTASVAYMIAMLLEG